MINLFIAIVRFCQARKKSDRLFFLLHLLILDVNATFCPLQGVAMLIWHVNACYIVFYFLRNVKPLRRKWTKKGKNAESAMFFISTVLSRRPKVTPLRLISVNFVRFLSSPSLFFTKLLTVIVLQQRAWPPASTGPMWAAPWRPIPCRVCLSTRRPFPPCGG